MRVTVIACLTIILFFLFHQTTFSPVGQLASADEADEALSQPVDWNKLASSRSRSALLDIPVIRQLPELYNGCEVTSVSMLLNAAGKPVDKVRLSGELKKDPTEFQGSSLNDIREWGDPSEGFVGDITGQTKGYGVNSGPVFDLIKNYLSNRAINLTGKDFSIIEWMISEGSPVIVWTTTDFEPTDEWVTWKKGDHTIKGTFKEHVVLLVGYDEKYVYINDPLTGAKDDKIPLHDFVESWKQMGSQALSFAGKKVLLALND
jgi:uncharacterized protein YvpB